MVQALATPVRHSYWVPMVGHAFRILETFYDAETELSLREVSARVQVGKTSALRILFTLNKLGYIDKNPETGKYQLSLKILEAARQSMSGRNLVQIARPYMKELRSFFGETVNLVVFRGQEIVYVEVLESRQSFRFVTEVGSRAPLHASALGKAIAAFLPEASLQACLKACDLAPLTPRTITSRQRLMKVLEQVRKQGYAFDSEEVELGCCCIAAPILNSQQEAVAALSLAGPSYRVRARRRSMTQHLKRASSSISHTMEVLGLG